MPRRPLWPWALALLALPGGPQAATTCPESGIAPPSEITLAAAASGADDVAILVKNADCDEVSIAATASENPGEYRINASYVDIAVVESYPAVASLWLWNNKIKEFKAVGTSVTEMYESATVSCGMIAQGAVLTLSMCVLPCKRSDLTSNQLTSLDGFAFPSSLQMLTLDLNALKATSASDFPDALQKLYLRKNSIASLAKFRFPASLQSLYLNGNQQLTTLEGAVLPDSLQYLTLGGTTVTNFVVRESDVELLQSAQLSLTVSLASGDCSGTVTAITDGVSACVLDGEERTVFPPDFPALLTLTLCLIPVDATFASLYPTSSSSDGGSTASATSSDGSSSSTSASPSSSSTATGSSSSTPQQADGSGATTIIQITETSGSSHTGMYVGVAVAAVVLVLAVVGFVLYRRWKQQRQRKSSTAGDFVVFNTSASKDPSSIATLGTGSVSQTLSSEQPPSSGGYLSNDVRNDEDLIPYRLPIADLSIQKELATGGFGIVYLARLYSQLVVVKQILPKAASKERLRRFMDEIRLYARMDHPKIVRFIGLAWTNLLDLSLVMDYMSRGDLTTLLQRNRREKGGRQSFTWLSDRSLPRSKIALALDLAEALVYLHSFDPPIIHRDLKSRNILLSHEWEAKLSDFGISRESSNETTMTGGMGTTAWISPEVLQGDRYSESADIYSFGIVLSELDTCGHPYNSNRRDGDVLTDAKIALLVSTNAIKPTVEADCPAEIRALILKCVAFDRSERPTAVALHYQLRLIANAYLEQQAV
ncbi:hypothetical protein BBJ28_00015131 [Nothophytophthora sp. Chile5]|nr:hypothetical protein BBJ28_00015131 [Nothophytophthora sp. Chile5]